MIRAADPPAALKAAFQQQEAARVHVSKSMGIDSLIALREQYRLAATPVSTSMFVSLPNAAFHRLKTGLRIDGGYTYSLEKGEDETIDLGVMSAFAPDPSRRYTGTRYDQETTKSFRFRMASRAHWSRIQLGYRLVVAGVSHVLIPYSSGDFAENLTDFPTEPIHFEVNAANNAYDVMQSHVFTNHEEDLFEQGLSLPAAPDSTWLFGSPGWRGRLFQNERMGEVSLAVDVSFSFIPSGLNYTGEASVTITNLKPREFPDGAVVSIQVFETHMDGSEIPVPVEDIADSMTIHACRASWLCRPNIFMTTGLLWMRCKGL